jgi:hypothetical protein
MRMRAQPVPSSERQRRRSDPAARRRTRASADGLWLARATRDQSGVAWSAVTDAVAWQVVCWDGDDAAVGRIRLRGRHRRATFARLAGLRQPFTIAVSGLGADGSVRWQRGLADLYLPADQTTGDERASDFETSAATKARRPGREGCGGSEAAEEGCRRRQDRRVEQAEAEEEDLAREVVGRQGLAPGQLRDSACLVRGVLPPRGNFPSRHDPTHPSPREPRRRVPRGCADVCPRERVTTVLEQR